MAISDAERLTTLEDAYFSGVSAVRIDGQWLEYQSPSAMWDAVLRLRRVVSPASVPSFVSFRPTMYSRGRS